ncbi:MAG: histidine phosphatase family protein [Actinomycetota bacterium]|nr:histidine phosphatase family protein [Actinomycetota bacterium]
MTEARIALLRHGQTEWSANGRHTSVTDLDLTPEGEQQATAVRGALAVLGIDPQTVLSSPRLRAQRTAAMAGLTVTSIVDDLAEWNYGDYEGLTSVEIRAQQPGWSLFVDGCPGGESPEQVGARADRALATAASSLSKGDVVLIGHGHFSRVLAARWTGLPVTAGAVLEMDAAAVSVLGHYHDDRSIEHLNVPAAVATAGRH